MLCGHDFSIYTSSSSSFTASLPWRWCLTLKPTFFWLQWELLVSSQPLVNHHHFIDSFLRIFKIIQGKVFVGIGKKSAAKAKEKVLTWRRDAAKASWELLSRVLNCEQILRASLAALRLSMASWATLRFHSGVMAGGLTNVIRWIIYKEEEETHIKREKHSHLIRSPCTLKMICMNVWDTDLFDLLPNESRDRRSRMKGDLYVIGSI